MNAKKAIQQSIGTLFMNGPNAPGPQLNHVIRPSPYVVGGGGEAVAVPRPPTWSTIQLTVICLGGDFSTSAGRVT